MSNQFKEQRIAIKDLSLWDENARFPDEYFNKTETELIEYFLSSEKIYKIKSFAKAVVDDFDLPQLEKIVVLDNDERLIVLEGNRRLTVYKLLNNPELITNLNIKGFFKNLSSRISIDENYKLDCLVTEDQGQGLRYIERKHEKGNNEVGWGDAERAHDKDRRGRAKKNDFLKIGISKIVRKLNLPEKLKENVLGRGYVTTFFRLLVNQQAWDIFGFKLDDRGNLTVADKDFENKLKVIILNILKKKNFNGDRLDSRSLNKSEQIEAYLKSIKKEDVTKVKEEIEKSSQKTLWGDTITTIKTGTKRSFPKSSARKYLIPRDCILQIPQTKINNIYKELRDDLILDDTKKSVPNAAGVLFRVFLEISIDYLLDKEGISLPEKAKLTQKINKAANFLEANEIAKKDQLANIRKVATYRNNILSIQNFHDYVHSYKSEPTSNDLKTKWDNLQEFFEILWEYLCNRKSLKKTP